LPLLIPALFAIIGTTLYLNSLDVPFYFDDVQNIVINKHIQIDEITWSGLKEAAFLSNKPTRPVANISFALNYYFGGKEVAGYHVVNIAIHVINAILVFWLVRLTLQLPALGYAFRDATLVAFFTALLWLVNPVHTQTVTYIVERWNSLAVMFYLGAFLMYIHGRLALRPAARWLLFFAGAVSGLLGMLTKEMTAVLPFFILLYEWFFFQNLRRASLWRNLVLVGVMLLVFVVIASFYTADHYKIYNALLRFDLPEYTNRWFTLNERLLTEPRVVLFYLGLLAFPAPSRLNLDYDFPLSLSLWDPPATFISIAVILALLVSALLVARRERLLAFCILWYLGHLVMESSVIGLEIIFEHRSYLPSIGVFLLVVALAFRTGFPRAVAAGFCILAVIWSFWTIERNSLWAEPVAFWSDVVSKSPNIARPYNALGLALVSADRFDEAVTQFTRAIDVHEQFKIKHLTAARPTGLTTYDWIQARAYYKRGAIRLSRDEFDEAKIDFNQAIRIAPKKILYAYLYRGLINQYQDKPDAAMKDFTLAFRLKPNNYDVREYRGDLRLQNKDYPGAIADYRKMTELKPDDPDAHRKLGKVLVKLRRYKDARQALQTALELAPPDWEDRQLVEFKLLIVRELESRNRTRGADSTAGSDVKPE